MKLWLRVLAGLAVTMGLTDSGLRAQDEDRYPHAKLDVPAERMERSASGWRLPPTTDRELAGRYRMLFAGASDEQLLKLAEDPEAGVALQAALELAMRASATSKPAAFARLFHLANRHVGMPLPRWWQEDISGENLHGPRKSFPPDDGIPARIKEVAPGRVLYEAGEQSIYFSLPTSRTMLSLGGQLGCDCDVALTKSRAFLAAVHGYSGVLCAFEMPAGKFEWQAEIWAFFRGILGGWIDHLVQVVATEERVVVIGSGRLPSSAYLEVFEARTGRNIFRFCSGYWTMAEEVRGTKSPPAAE